MCNNPSSQYLCAIHYDNVASIKKPANFTKRLMHHGSPGLWHHHETARIAGINGLLSYQPFWQIIIKQVER